MGGDAALGDHPGGAGVADAGDDVDDGVGDGAGDREGGRGVIGPHQLAAGVQDHVGRLQGLADAPGGLDDDVLAPGLIEQAGHRELDLHQPRALLDHRELLGGEPHVGADDDEAVRQTVGAANGYVPIGEDAGPRLTGEGSHEGRRATGQDRTALLLEAGDGLRDDLHVGVLGRVDDRPLGVAGRAEDADHGVDAAGADVLEGHAQHVGLADVPPGALGEEGGEVGGGVAEGGVAGEVGSSDLDRLPVDGGVVDPVAGEATGLDHRRAQQDRVDVPTVLGEDGGERGGLGDDVSAQGRVGAGDDVQRRGVHARGDHALEDPPVQGDGVGLVEGPGVGEHEAGRAGLGERRGGGRGVGVEDDVDIGHALRAGGVVVEDEQAAVGTHGGSFPESGQPIIATSGHRRAATPRPTIEVAVVATV